MVRVGLYQWRLVGKIIGGAHLKNFIGTISIVNSETGNKINILLKYEHTSIYIFFFYIIVTNSDIIIIISQDSELVYYSILYY